MREQLKNGLELRSLSEGIASDRENVAAFYVDVFSEYEEDAPAIGIWVNDLTAGTHPTVTLDDIWVVVDTKQDDRIVSALLLIPQTWRYEDVSFGVGRVELVATHKDYRRRGLIRALMNVAHKRSADLGHKMQVITGIPHYYRQFGYTMAVDLGIRATLAFDSVPELKEDQKARFSLREATKDDIPNLIRWGDHYAVTRCLSVVNTQETWDYELNVRSAGAPMYQRVCIITRDDGVDVGFVAVRISDYGKFFNLNQYVVGPESSYLETFDDVARAMKAMAEEYYAEREEKIRSAFMYFDSGVHPVVETIVRGMGAGGRAADRTYAWYVRVPDVADFLEHIGPVLERRLQGSGANRYSGTLKVAFLNETGISMTFENGKLTKVEPGAITFRDSNASFPYEMFLNVMLGHRTADEINYLLPDGGVQRDARVLFEALFPSKRSFLAALT